MKSQKCIVEDPAGHLETITITEINSTV